MATDDDDDDVLLRAARDIRATPGLEAFVPLTPAEREQLADRAIAQVLGPESAPAPAPVAMRRRRRVPAYIASVVAAAALAVVLVPYLGRGRGAEPLATYAMQVEGEQTVRGAAPPSGDAPVVVRPETRVVIRLDTARPERDALIRLVLVRNGNAALLDPAIARSKAGAFEIAGPAAELFGVQTDGAGEIVAVLGRALPDDDAVRALARAGTPPAAIQVLRRAIVFAGFSHTAVDALLGGCSAVLAAARLPRCEVATGAALALWVGVPADAAVEVRLDGARVASAAEGRGGG
ncbi:MAG TPA: hypothetical protein VFD36_22940, partial [Kofleriaceae bacterium]|nr:hypothetical protein [Kofleriaceae bacterium]